MSDVPQFSPPPPKFNIDRLSGAVVISMNLPMAQALFNLLDIEGDDPLHPYEFAFRERLGNVLRPRDSNSYSPR